MGDEAGQEHPGQREPPAKFGGSRHFSETVGASVAGEVGGDQTAQASGRAAVWTSSSESPWSFNQGHDIIKFACF